MDTHNSLRSAVEMTAESVIREYLSRKGLKGTLGKMDEECPRNEYSISNRQALMKQLNLEKLMKKNKESTEPLKTMLEIMTKHFIERRSQISETPREISNKSMEGFGANISFSPQTNEPIETLRPSAHKTSNVYNKDLVIDDDVHGESVIGDGLSGLISAKLLDSTSPVSAKPQLSRPLSSRPRIGAIMSNNDKLERRGYMNKPKTQPHTHILQQKQQQKLPDNLNADSNKDMITTNRENFTEEKFDSIHEDPPASFEALLMKGAERANLLSRIGLDDNNHKVTATESYKVENSSMNKDKSNSRNNRNMPSDSTKLSSSKVCDLEMGDIDDLDSDVSTVQLQHSGTRFHAGPTKLIKSPSKPSTPIDLKTAATLKTLVLGSPSGLFIDDWILQGFSFCDFTDLKYGIVQKKGGPCGVLAAVQACMIQEMVFGDSKIADFRIGNPSRTERSKCLAAAITHILWRAGDSLRAVVALPGDASHIINSSKFKHDGITEKLSLYTFTNKEELSNFILQSISVFENEGSSGVILIMYSAILSRKPYQVRYDFDVQDTTMIASHGYCSQEIVNLLLTGRAVSNTFNDSIILDSGGTNDDSVTLKGLTGRSEIGLLSLFEHYKSCQVGTYFKTPKFPIWVVCSESHFSVLFSTRRDLVNDWKAERRFDLFYYDGLSRQQEEIRLTISTLNQSYKPPNLEDDLVPPLEHCIRTKWPDAEIDWNGYDPIL